MVLKELAKVAYGHYKQAMCPCVHSWKASIRVLRSIPASLPWNSQTLHYDSIRLSVSTVNRTYELSRVTHVTCFHRHGKHSTGTSTFGLWIHTYSKFNSSESLLTLHSYKAQSIVFRAWRKESHGLLTRIRRYGLLYFRACEYVQCGRIQVIGWHWSLSPCVMHMTTVPTRFSAKSCVESSWGN